MVCGKKKIQFNVSHMCKRILDSNFNQAVIDKISNFHELHALMKLSQILFTKILSFKV